MMISLLGTINVKFLDIEGNNQTISIQLPSYVLANFMRVEGKPQVSLISGNMVLEDKGNQLKSVIFVRGLLKKKGLFQTTFEPNLGKGTKKEEKLIDGIIYKTKEVNNATKRPDQIEKISDIEDMGFELASIAGQAIDKPIIQNVSYSNWAGVHFADPIP